MPDSPNVKDRTTDWGDESRKTQFELFRLSLVDHNDCHPIGDNLWEQLNLDGPQGACGCKVCMTKGINQWISWRLFPLVVTGLVDLRWGNNVIQEEDRGNGEDKITHYLSPQ